ncbi:DUF6894 family protein [Methylobacterium oryzihabitans]|uniref:DUF6894 domain-containing protein n=1 Tax=Methylobacterium oryzihabitans TaxID=2499852 RepID=A0A3S2VNY8_9HYPH|nr:hypothetical protein [Methylobacterium oryzihabitans]RVU17247.1 hypothetical protein EOE48_15080 [Methylobacterium oryzihabitans]
MPRYFIDFEDGGTRLNDDDGQDFADLQAARDAAIGALPDVGREVPPGDGRRLFMAHVRGEDGQTLCTIRLELDARCRPDPAAALPEKRER